MPHSIWKIGQSILEGTAKYKRVRLFHGILCYNYVFVLIVNINCVQKLLHLNMK